jgi:hypothetical protein
VNPDVIGRPVDGSPSGAAAPKPAEPQSEAIQELTRRIQAEYAEMAWAQCDAGSGPAVVGDRSADLYGGFQNVDETR